MIYASTHYAGEGMLFVTPVAKDLWAELDEPIIVAPRRYTRRFDSTDDCGCCGGGVSLGQSRVPLSDPALLAHWAEEVGRSMQAKGDSVGSARRYAFAALHGKVRDWRKTGAAKEIAVGIGPELERWAGITKNAQRSVDQKILVDQLKTTLNERDRYILVLLLQDVTSPADVSVALGVSYGAAAKAIQRVRERIASLLSGASTDQALSGESPHFCETKG